MKVCPCSSGLPYASCCGPLHRGAREAETPEALMRSRFAAFAVCDADYLVRTLHPAHEDAATSPDALKRSILTTSRSLKFIRLHILEARGDRVLFLARVFDKGKDRSFAELSTFARHDGAWKYKDGILRSPVDVPVASAWTFDAFEKAPA